MKTLCTMVLLIGLCALACGCSPVEQQEREIERLEDRLDPIAQQGEALSRVVHDAAAGAQAIGVPGAGVVALIASLVGTMLGAYNERRRGTVPMRNALEQVVQSVEAAFPDRSDGQKATMASVQDRATRRIVSGIKGE